MIRLHAADARKQLLERFPFHKALVDTILLLFADHTQPLPPHVHIRTLGGRANHIVDLVNLSVSTAQHTVPTVIRPLTCPSVQHAFRRIILNLSSPSLIGIGEVPRPASSTSSQRPYRSASNTLHDDLKSYILTRPNHTRVVIVIPEAEKMRDVWDEPSLGSLFDVCRTTCLLGRVSIVSISELSSEHIFPCFASASYSLPFADAIQIVARHSGKHDLVAQLQRDISDNKTRDSKSDSDDDDRHLHSHVTLRTFLSLAYDTLSSETRSIYELGSLASEFWCSYMREKVIDASMTIDLTHAVSIMRMKISEERRFGRSVVSLPFLPSCLLIASFLASYCQPRTDVQMFVREDVNAIHDANARGKIGRKGSLRKKGGPPRKRARRKIDSANQLFESTFSLGPRSFALDRLLSIHESVAAQAEQSVQKISRWNLTSAEEERSTSVLACLNDLLRAGYMVRTTTSDRLDANTSIRTNVTQAIAIDLARKLRIELGQYFSS